MDILENLKGTELSGHIFTSLIVMLIMIILAIVIGIKARLQNPLKRPKGILLLAEYGVNFFENFAEGMLGKHFRSFGGYIMVVGIYMFLAFIFGLTGPINALMSVAGEFCSDALPKPTLAPI